MLSSILTLAYAPSALKEPVLADHRIHTHGPLGRLKKRYASLAKCLCQIGAETGDTHHDKGFLKVLARLDH